MICILGNCIKKIYFGYLFKENNIKELVYMIMVNQLV